MYGYSAQEAIGSSISMLVPGGFAKDLDLIFEKLRRGERIEHYETVRVHKDGKSLYVSLSIFPIFDTHGKARGRRHHRPRHHEKQKGGRSPPPK